MKINNFFLALSAFAGAMIFSSCDDISPEDRFIPVERPTVARNVLVMEFTGMHCNNCPKGHETVANLQTLYPGAVIAVSMHPAGTSFTAPMLGLNLANDMAKEYQSYYKAENFPWAIVDGRSVESVFSNWTTAVTEDIEVPAPADIHVTTTWDEATRTVSADYDVVFNNMYDGSLNLLLWVVENDIVGPQLQPNGQWNFTYTHNHVFRSYMNGVWGETIGSSFRTEQSVTGTASLKLNDAWKADNCHVIAVLLQTSSKNVEQAASVHLISGAEE